MKRALSLIFAVCLALSAGAWTHGNPGTINAFLGPFLTLPQTVALGAPFSTLETIFTTNEPGDWAEAATWTQPYNEIYSGGAVYERPTTLWAKAEQLQGSNPSLAATYRTEAQTLTASFQNNYLSIDWPFEPYQQWYSSAVFWMLTGDTNARQYAGWMGTYVAYYQSLGNYASVNGFGGQSDERLLAYGLAVALSAKRVNALGTARPGFSIPAYVGTWDTLLRNLLNDILSIQDADGGWRMQGYSYSVSGFMTGLIATNMITYYNYFEADARIPVAVKKAMNFLWENMLEPDNQTLIYSELFDTNNVVGTINWNEDTDDVNNWYLDGYGWLYYLSGDTTYRARALTLATRYNSGAFVSSYKQLSEGFIASRRWPYYYSTAPIGTTSVINSVAPSVTGTTTLTCNNGTWSGSPTHTYKWKGFHGTGVLNGNLGSSQTLSTSGLSGYQVYCLDIPSGDGIPARSNWVTIP